MRTLKLGKLPVKHDERTLKLGKYFQDRMAPPPPTVDWYKLVKTWPMYANDSLGDCTIAAVAHMIESWTTNACKPILPTTDDVIAAYSAITGYDPQTGEGDNGANELDVLNYWRRNGIAGHKIKVFATLKMSDHVEIMQAINLFGGIYVGAAMPTDAQEQTSPDLVWTVTQGSGAQPGSWGGHAFPIGAYDKDKLCCITWGARQLMTWDWFDTYVEEAYALISTDMLEMSGLTPLGMNIATLIVDLAKIGEDIRRAELGKQ